MQHIKVSLPFIRFTNIVYTIKIMKKKHLSQTVISNNLQKFTL